MPPTAVQPPSAIQPAVPGAASTSRNTKLPNGSLANPTAYQLRSLIMDYLCHHCYTRTAVAFARDSTVRHLDADGDEIVQPKEKGILGEPDALELSQETLREAELRNKIRVKILSGGVDDAIDLLNEYFPSVLAPSTPGPKFPASAMEAMSSSKHLIPTTTDPRHLLLNLRILGFTELCRTKPLLYSPPLPVADEFDMEESSTSSEPVNLDPDGNALIPHFRGTDSESSDTMDTDEMDTDMDADDEERTPPTGAVETGDDNHVLQLIQQGQKLYALLDQISNTAEKELYAQELVNVGALLAYPEPENSPLARYLSMERREAVAEQINKAILVRTSQPPTSKIEVMTRYTTVLWALANEMKIKARPGALVPPISPARTPTPPIQTKQGPETEQVVPSFNLQTFLELR